MPDETETVPLARLQRVIEEREALKTELAAARAASEALKTAAAERDAARTELAEVRAKGERDASAWRQERVMLERGLVDPEAREVAALLHSRIPVENRPDLAAWLDGMRADPASAPKPLAPYFAPAPTASATTATTATTAPPWTPPGGAPPPRPAETTPAAGARVSAEALRAAGERVRREGTPEARAAYDALRGQLVAELGGGG